MPGVAPSYAGNMRSEVNPRLSDLGLALAMTLVLAVVIAADPASRTSLGGYAFALGFGLLMLLRRRLPRAVLVVTMLAIFAYYTLDLPPVGMVLPAIGALLSAAEQRRTLWSIASAAVLLAVATYFRLDGSEQETTLNGYTFVTEVALAAAAIALGAAVRLTREARERSARIAELTAAEEAHAADARMQAERMQIARDLHDTIGHTLSVASLHAGVAAEATDAAASASALDQVRTATTESLRELRRTVRFLRSDDASVPAPVLGLASLDALFAAARTAGLQVVTEISVDSDTMSPSVDAAAFRIVQESLTNVLRHADASTVRVTARAADGVLLLRIVDDGRGIAGHTDADVRAEGSRFAASALIPRPTATSPAGHGAVSPRIGAGIQGMRERAELLGGTLSATPAPGGFIVEAKIPVRAEGDG